MLLSSLLLVPPAVASTFVTQELLVIPEPLVKLVFVMPLVPTSNTLPSLVVVYLTVIVQPTVLSVTPTLILANLSLAAALPPLTAPLLVNLVKTPTLQELDHVLEPLVVVPLIINAQPPLNVFTVKTKLVSLLPLQLVVMLLLTVLVLV